MTFTDELRARFERAGQGHVFAHVDSLDADAAARFAAELADVDLDLVGRLAAVLKAPDGAAADPKLEPCAVIPAGEPAKEARSEGERALAAGEVGFVLVAGGQGSRLGFDGPKGAFPVGPLTGRTLFDWHAGRILAAGRRHGFRPTWAVMTSRTNDEATRAFFSENDHFGLPAEDVWFFRQDMLPALDGAGRILLSGPGELFLAPNGHGGTLQALSKSGVLARFAERGVKTLSYFQVDNPLARPADPVFVGHHCLNGSEMSSKVVPKCDPMEKVGVLGLVDGVLGCIEYSDLSEELRETRNADGDLVFNAGNIAVHMIDCGFVERLNAGGDLDLPWHVARKRISTIDETGAPTQVDGVKFETFVFDALGRATSSVTLEVDRAEEFSPVKNAEGADSPGTCRADLSRIGGVIVGRSADVVEVDPRAAETAEEFAARGMPVIEQAGGLLVEPGGLSLQPGWVTWSEARTAAALSLRPVAVLMGGRSGERDVSLTSGRAVLAALREPAGPSGSAAPRIFEVEIDRGGAWCLDGVQHSPQRLVEALPADTVFFLALHGGAGEDGRVQAFLELCGRVHTGAGPQTSALCMDKHRSRLVASSAGVRVARGAFATCGEIRRDRDAALARLCAVDAPVRFAKDVTGGSSIGVHRCADDGELASAVEMIVAGGGDVLVEAGIVGLETTCGLIGDGAEAHALPIVEIEPRGGAFFDLEQKYAAEGGALETCPPRHLHPDLASRVQARAMQAWEAFGGAGYARIDFMIPGAPDGAGGWCFDQEVEPIMLEANTLPGFTPRSLLPLAAGADGVGFRELCIELIARAIRD